MDGAFSLPQCLPSKGVEQSHVIAGILVTVIIYVRYALFLFICILRYV